MKPYEGVGTMSDADYIAIAHNDPTWREVAASFAIEGMEMTEENLIVAGKMIAGEIGLAEAIEMIRTNAGITARAGELTITDSLH